MRNFLVILIVIVFFSCKKKEGPSQTPPTVPPVTSVTVKKFLVDSSVSKFISSEQDIVNGDFKYDFLPGVDNMKKGDFFIEPRDYGYLRKIEAVSKANGQVVVSTTQGTLSEFYKDSGLITRSFSIPNSENPFAKTTAANARVAANLPTVNISGQGWSLSLEKLNFSFNPNWVFECDVKNEYLKAGFERAQTTFEYDLSVTADFKGTAETEFKLSSIFPVSKILKLRIPNLFLQVHVVDFIVKVKIEGGGKLEPKFHYKKQNQINAYLEYKNAVLNGVYNITSPIYENTRTMSVTGGLTATVEVYPIIRIREFGIPIVNLGVKGIFETEVKHSLVYDTWDLKSHLYGGFFANFNKTAFQFVAPDEFIIITPKLLIVEAPKEIKRVSGGIETPTVNQTLNEPIVFQVFENNKLKTSEPEALVNVFFSSDYGKWGNVKVRTGADGKVTNTFKMGPEEKEHTLTATIKNAENVVINSVVLKITPSLFVLSGISFNNLANTGAICSFYKSCSYDMNFNFQGTTAPTSGSILWKIVWDNNGDGIFEGNANGAFNTSAITAQNSSGNIVTLPRIEFCWGSAITKLKFITKYKTQNGTEGNIIESLVPQY